MGVELEAVELEVDVRPQPLELADEAAVAGQADAVGVQHHHPDPALLRHLDEANDVLVDRGLAARELDHLRLALRAHEGVEHRRHLILGQGIAVGLVARVGEADRAVQVAAGVDLDDPEAGVLLVLGAEPAVERAALGHLGLELERQRAGLVVALLRHVELGVRVDERLELAVVGAALAQHDPVVADQHLGVHHDLAQGADRLRVLEEDFFAVPARHSFHQAGGSSASSTSRWTSRPTSR